MISHDVEKIGPEEATAILDRNTKNRRLSSAIVNKLAQQMKAGLWNFDGSPIRIDEHGDLVDGQHRLWAVIESETTQEFLVIRGVDELAMATMDTGKSRSFADILTLEVRGLGDANGIAAATSIIYRWEQGARGSKLRAANSNFVPYPTLLKFFRDNQERIIDVAKTGRNRATKTGVTSSVFALATWVLEDIASVDADFFFERIRDGVGLGEDHPILALRNWMVRSYSLRPRPQPEMALALIFKAWNAYRQGEDMKQLSWRRGGANPEPFPLPV